MFTLTEYKKKAFKNSDFLRGGCREGEVAQTMYTHVSKCKNNRIKTNSDLINIYHITEFILPKAMKILIAK
jgi:hypothetical protein